ncbi:MAG: EamA family transporter [Patescibacteria group bacterium]
MNWILLAIIGHAANGVAFVIDKSLLSTAFKRSATYAGLVGILSFIVIAAAPWVKVWPHGNPLTISLISGALFVVALWAFYEALARAEASRIVPIVGSLIPILTLLGTSIFLGEHLRASQLIGFALLVAATAILSSSGGGSRPSRASIGLAVVSAILFAVSSVTAKYSYDTAGFLPAFVASRLSAAVVSVFIVVAIDRVAGRELWSMLKPKQGRNKKAMKSAGVLAVVGQSLGAGGFLCVQLAASGGSAAIVNALQAVQYALLVIAALFLKHRAPKLLGENLEGRVLFTKITALIVAAIGLAFVI